jgi:hypothetical protein
VYVAQVPVVIPLAGYISKMLSPYMPCLNAQLRTVRLFKPHVHRLNHTGQEGLRLGSRSWNIGDIGIQGAGIGAQTHGKVTDNSGDGAHCKEQPLETTARRRRQVSMPA